MAASSGPNAAAAPAPAVVLSGNIDLPNGRSLNEAALALTRSLGRHGVPIVRFHPDRRLADLSSRYCVHRACPNLYDDPEGLAGALEAFARECPTMPVLFPASDGAAHFVARYAPRLARSFALTSPSAKCIAKTQNKRTLLELAARSGVGTPTTHYPQCQGELESFADSLTYPVVVKPLVSSAWKTAAAVTALGERTKALTPRGPEELLELGRRLWPLRSPFMVQEIVPGPEEGLLTYLGYVGRDGCVLAGCVRKKLRQWPPGFGYCTLTESTLDPEIERLSAKLLDALGYRGLCGIEFKRDERDGVPKLVEVNTRAVRTTALAPAAGVDVPWIGYRDATGQPVAASRTEAPRPVRWVHLYDEMKAASSLALSGELSALDWLGGFRGKKLVSAEFAWDDPLPALAYWGSRKVPGLGRIQRAVSHGRAPLAEATS